MKDKINLLNSKPDQNNFENIQQVIDWIDKVSKEKAKEIIEKIRKKEMNSNESTRNSNT